MYTLISVRASKEPGWLEGQLNGKTGLVPENYVEYIDWCNISFIMQYKSVIKNCIGT